MAKKVFTSLNFYLSVAILLMATKLNFVSGNLIKTLYPYRQPINDFLFDRLPLVSWTQYLTDIFVILTAVITLYYFIKYQIKYLPYAIMAFAIFYLLRSGLVLLNPFSGFYGHEATYGISTIKQYGCFPSGHTGLTVVAYMLTDKSKSKAINIILYLLVIGEVLSLLLSRGHYGIDIVGGLLLAYFVVTWFGKYKEKLVL